MKRHAVAAHVLKPWWTNRAVLALCVLLTAVPLLGPTVPPLVDLPGHMGRYAVQLAEPASPLLTWYRFDWKLIGNLGVDLWVESVGRLIGIEAAVKAIVVAIPMLAAAGLLWIAREVHGRVPPTAFFALPLVLAHPFVFGFVNFSLAMALALLGFALWLRMARIGAARRRWLVFAPLACVVWVAHTFGWGLLGLLCFSAETVRQRDLGRGWIDSGWRAALACLPMALPLVPMIVWRSGAVDMTGDLFNWDLKALWLLATLRDRWQAFDVASVAVLAGVIILALRHPALTFSRNLAVSALVLLAVYVLLPRIIFGSAYADMRLTPYIFAIAIVAIRPRAAAPPRLLATLAIAGLAFFAARVGGHSVSFALAAERQQLALTALDVIPRGSRIAYFTQRTCGVDWSTNRMEHLAGLATLRRQAFANNQWEVSGANPLTVLKDDAPRVAIDPSQLVLARPCAGGSPWMTIDEALRTLPRQAFDYVWLVDVPRYDARLTVGMTPVWQNRRGDRLYRIDR